MKKIAFIFLFSFLFILGCDRVIQIIESDPEPTGEIVLHTDKTGYTAGDSILITLDNRGSEPVYLDGCSVFFLADRSDSGWVISPLHICVWEGFAQKLLPGEKHQETLASAAIAGVHKIYARIHWSCQDGQPISQAKCLRMEDRWSGEFYVKK